MAAIFGVVLLLLLLLSFILESKAPISAPAASTSSAGRVAYFEFGTTADTFWLASVSDPSSREAIFTAPHAREFGVVPSISPSGHAVAYTALPESTAAPGPDAPADLWYAPLTGSIQPRLLASDIDLLVAPVWTPDAKRLVYRRSDTTGYGLVEMSADGGTERVLATSSASEALFPVGFTPDGATFYHVALSEKGTQLFAVAIASGETQPVALLSEELTRDWALSPDGSELAFLSLSYTPQAINSRAFVIDLASAEIEPVTDANASAFGPVWDRDGRLVVGTLMPGGESSFVRVEGGRSSQTLGESAGFDVPLAYLPGGAYLVRAFEGASATNPGRAFLTLIDSNGERHVLSQGDVTFAGWSGR
jgi:hypothetical protein